MKVLQQNLDVARNFKRLSHEEVASILANTEAVAANGHYELYKLSTEFDGTTHHPQWLG